MTVRRSTVSWLSRKAPRFLGVCLLLASGALTASPYTVGAWAQFAVAYLGPPTGVPNPYPHVPLGGFHRTGKSEVDRGRLVVRWIGTLARGDAASASERWALLKTLEQFGSFENVTKAKQSCRSTMGQRVCEVATFDWSKAKYTSPYVVFKHIDMLNHAGRPYQQATGEDRLLYYKYIRLRSCDHIPLNGLKTEYKRILFQVGAQCPPSDRNFPLLQVDGYTQTVSGLVLPADFTALLPPVQTGAPNDVYSGIPFDEVRRRMVSGQDASGSLLVYHVNAEADLLMALICRGDGLRPSRLCSKPWIRHQLRYIRPIP